MNWFKLIWQSIIESWNDYREQDAAEFLLNKEVKKVVKSHKYHPMSHEFIDDYQDGWFNGEYGYTGFIRMGNIVYLKHKFGRMTLTLDDFKIRFPDIL